MKSLSVSKMVIYPIKSFRGIPVSYIDVSMRGIKHDRVWMLVDEEGRFVTQRQAPDLIRFKVRTITGGIEMSHPDDDKTFELPWNIVDGDLIDLQVKIWKSFAPARYESREIDAWISGILGKKVRFVRFPDRGNRDVRLHPGSGIAFQDGHQLLLMGQASVDELNARLENPINGDGFRANLIFSGGAPYSDERWNKIKIGMGKFGITKSCGGCKVINIDQDTAYQYDEPLRTLSTYRKQGNSVIFGTYLKLISPDEIRLHTGDPIIEIID